MSIIENFAERLFCDLKNNGIKIEKPEYVHDGAKIGSIENSSQFYIIGINGKFKVGKGVATSLDVSLTFTEAYSKFLDQIKNLEHVKFYTLVIPRKSVIETKLEEFETVVSRYIKDYMPMNDEVAERWDVMVQKVIKNA